MSQSLQQPPSQAPLFPHVPPILFHIEVGGVFGKCKAKLLSTLPEPPVHLSEGQTPGWGLQNLMGSDEPLFPRQHHFPLLTPLFSLSSQLSLLFLEQTASVPPPNSWSCWSPHLAQSPQHSHDWFLHPSGLSVNVTSSERPSQATLKSKGLPSTTQWLWLLFCAAVTGRSLSAGK